MFPFWSDTMNATADRPSAIELDQLAGLLSADSLDRAALAAALRRIEQGLHEHEHSLNRSDGLLNEQDKARRMSLAREDDRLRGEMAVLIQDVQAVREAMTDGSDDDALRRRGGELLAGLRGHRDAEASLVLENADTDVGSGD
jgi:hypothetical protein